MRGLNRRSKVPSDRRGLPPSFGLNRAVPADTVRVSDAQSYFFGWGKQRGDGSAGRFPAARDGGTPHSTPAFPTVPHSPIIVPRARPSSPSCSCSCSSSRSSVAASLRQTDVTLRLLEPRRPGSTSAVTPVTVVTSLNNPQSPALSLPESVGCCASRCLDSPSPDLSHSPEGARCCASRSPGRPPGARHTLD
jgi:hypothetical protein